MAKHSGHHRHLLLLFIAGILLLLNTGCASQKIWSYGVESEAISQQPIIDSSVAVPPLADRRTNDNSNFFAMYLIPVMPFGWQDYHTPEGAQMHMNSGMWTWRPNEDIAKAAAEELATAHLFKECFFTFRETDAQLVLRGEIASTDYNGKLLSYGVSAFAPYLWLVGFPSTHVKNEMDLSFKLMDKQNNRVLWQKTYKKEIGKLNWLYVTRADFEYSALLKQILLEVIADMKADIPKIQVAAASSGS